MKPLKLKMQAFGPYIKPVVLDFENNLRGEKIFLIHGATGAGKTTILDAICFALYGTASGDERNGAMMRSKGIADDTKTTVEFTFSLGEKIYTAYRVLTCKHDKDGNKKILQNAELLCDGEMITFRSTSVTNKIKELLSFDAEQFRQVVLLPQGEFKTFLSAKADERQPILDTLFNAAFYKKVEDGLKAKADAAQKILDDLNNKKAALEAQLNGAKVDDSALEKLRADFQAARQKADELKKISAETQAELTAGKKLAEDFAELERRDKSLVKAEEDFSQAEKIFTAAKTEYALRGGEQSLRDNLKVEGDNLAKIKNAFVELEGNRNAFKTAEQNLQTAKDVLKKCEDDETKFEKRLAELKKRRDELADAEKNLVEAQNISDKAKERENILRTIARLERELAGVRQKISAAEENLNGADLTLKRLQKLQLDGSAARLAAQLKDGEPCPVCGSRTHQAIDFSDTIIPRDKEIDDAQKEVDLRKKILDGEKNSAATIEGQLLSQRNESEKYIGVPAKEIAQKNFDEARTAAAEFRDCNERIDKGERFIEKNKAALEAARKNQTAALSKQAELGGAIQILQSQLPEKYSDNLPLLESDIEKAQKTLRELEEAWKAADKNFRDAGNKKSSCEGILKAAQDSQRELADKLKDKTPPELEALESRVAEAQKNYEAAIREETSLKNALDNLKKISVQLAELNNKISEAAKNFNLRQKLSEVASGKIRGKKISFVRYYLRAMFEQVLTEANYRLEKMSDRRYWFRQKDAGRTDNSTAGLNLEIFDEYTGESRPVATLSGGESFLASLSLALGLAAVVRNNSGGIKLDTIFIDEGFGSLDSETLDFAVATINELSGGRLVGIISHVEELKKQIPVRLEVTTSKTGSEAEFKYGLSRD